MPVSVQDFIQRGFLPENLPPPFRSHDLWAQYVGLGDAYQVVRSCTGALSTYDASKRGGSRRVFSLPHPTFIREIAVFFEKHWDQLEQCFAASHGSLSRPNLVAWPRAVRIAAHAELPKARLRAFSRFKYCAVADVSRFFPSIYTHTIPWAINGKVAAKADQASNSAAVFGNRLDFITRQAQDKQTIGIPIGPDTSRVTSELILSAADKRFEEFAGRKSCTYLRHVDDYWIGGHTVEECERHLQNLRLALNAYELGLNEFKTKIVPTNVVFGESWPTEFEQEIRSVLDRRRARDADTVAVLSKIVDRARAANDDGMIRHVIRKIDENRLWRKNWPVLEHFLAQSAIQFSHSFDFVARVIVWRLRIGEPVDKTLWKEVAMSLASQASSLGRDSEVLWSLWLLKELGVKVPKALSAVLIENSCPLVLGYLAHMYSKGLTNGRGLASQLWQAVDGDEYAGRHWPLSLELMHLDIANPGVIRSRAHDVLQILHRAKATLIDWAAVPPVFDRDQGDEPDDDDDPEYAIEDYTSDYDADGDDAGDDEEEDGGFTVDLPI